MKALEIAGRTIGRGEPCFVVAEAGVNHNGDLGLARRLVDAAAEAGADAVKFQTFSARRLATPDAPKAEYQKECAGAEESQLAMLERLELSPAAHEDLMDRARQRGLVFLSTPFEEESADLLERLGVSAFKIPSGEITNLPFLAHVARKRRPMIVSTGMATLDEVRGAVETIRGAGNEAVVLLHCVSAYPADPADANLRAMTTMEQALQVPVGYSDHTLGIEVALAAVALGACVVEKHLTLDRSLPGPDHRASSDPRELAGLVRAIRTVESALGHGRKEPVPGEARIAAVARKSLVALADIPAGAVLAPEMIGARRPGTGIPPAFASQVAGRRARSAIAAGTLIAWEMLE
jgi:N-acetylneuraminate synthase